MYKAIDFKCTNGECGYFNKPKEFLIEGNEVPVCICDGLMERVLHAHAGYKIKGNNSASQRPKQAGSFPRKK
jgi:hypothetical protein